LLLLLLLLVGDCFATIKNPPNKTKQTKPNQTPTKPNKVS
jgi:hypothetical protein